MPRDGEVLQPIEEAGTRVADADPPHPAAITAQAEPAPITIEVPPTPAAVAPPPPVPAPEIESPGELAADGRPEHMAAVNLGHLVNSLENGQLSADFIAALAALGQGMMEIADATGKRQKGSITLKLNLTTEGEAYFIEADYKVAAPKLPRPRTIAWQDEASNFTRSQPRQKVFFGVRDAGGGPRQIRDATKR